MKSLKFRIAALSFTVMLSFFLPVFAQEASAGQGDRDRLFGFAESLYSEGDYYRAITEYKRFIYHYPQDVLAEQSLFRIGECYYKAARHEEAIDAFRGFVLRYPAGPLRSEALYLKGHSENKKRRHEDALCTFDELIRTGGAEYHDRALYSRALVLLAQRNWQGAREVFDALPPASPLYPSAQLYTDGLGRMDALPRKSPELAGGLAALLPGAGHLYTERPRDAVVSFLLNACFILAAAELFRSGNHAAGGIVTFFELGWYSGNIYSAVSSAHKYNKRIQDDFLQGLQNRGGISLYRDRLGSNYIMYGMIF